MRKASILIFLFMLSGCAKKVPLQGMQTLKREIVVLNQKYEALNYLYDETKDRMSALKKKQSDLNIHLNYIHYYLKEVNRGVADKVRLLKQKIEKIEVRLGELEKRRTK